MGRNGPRLPRRPRSASWYIKTLYRNALSHATRPSRKSRHEIPVRPSAHSPISTQPKTQLTHTFPLLPRSWISTLGPSFQNGDLELISDTRYATRTDMLKAATENWLMVCQDIAPALAWEGDLTPQVVFSNVAEETQRGASVVADFVVVLGRKRG